MKLVVNIAAVVLLIVLSIGAYHLAIVRPALMADRQVAMLDVDQLLKDMVVALAQSGASDDEIRNKSTTFRQKLEEAARLIESRDRVVLINAAAVVGSASPDYTAVVREALELPAPKAETP